MITRLHLKNFRRHDDTELFFNPDDRLIVVAGDNGGGKTTIFEALQWGLYGETRHGRRGFDHIVRRGAELEGAEVTVEFNIAGSNYRVHRRRLEGVSSATLSVDGTAICSSPTAVDAEVARILGVDAAGFRLATYARQKELDGLTSLDRRSRRQILARLLRIEALGKAVSKSHERYSTATKVLEAMGPAPDIDQLEAEVTSAEAAATAAQTAADDAKAAVDEINRKLGETAQVEVTYRSAVEEHARARGALDAAIEERNRLGDRLARHVVPPAPTAEVRDLPAILDDLRDCDVEIAQARAAATARDDHEILVADHAEVVAKIAALDEQLANAADTKASLAAAEAELEALVADGLKARAAQEAARDAVTAARAYLTQTQDLLERARSLDASCSACGQDIPEEHRHTQELAAADAVTVAEAALAAAEKTFAEANTTLQERLAAHEALSATVKTLTAAMSDVTHRSRERAELTRRRDSYELRLNRELPTVGDLDELLARRDALTTEETQARAAAEARAAHETATAEQAALTEALNEARLKVTAAEARAAATQPPTDLEEAFADRQALLASRDAELELSAALGEAAAEARTRAEGARRRRDDAIAFAARHKDRADTARLAAYVKTVVTDVHAKLSAQLRPSLEGAVSEILARLSEGRFPSVQITDDYEVLVLDDGAYRGLGDLSGGETDLVALAVRLGLAQVVADRRGSDALGMLVLDEIFGSQDRGRRDSILVALRELVGMYGQIFLISHVGGLEEAADKVIEVAPTPDRADTVVTII